MIYRSDEPDSTDELLQAAAESEAATHRLALYLGTTDDRVRENPSKAMLAALSKLPARHPLRRDRDRVVIQAVRTLVRDLPSDAPSLTEILDRLTEVSRQAAEHYWPSDTWKDAGS